MAKSFEQLLVEGAVNAVRALSLDELHDQLTYLDELDLPESISEFPRMVLSLVIAEKQQHRSFN